MNNMSIKHLVTLAMVGLLLVGNGYAAEDETTEAGSARPRYVKIKTYPNLGLLIPALVAGGFCYHYADDWHDYNNVLDAMGVLGVSTSSEGYLSVERKGQKAKTRTFISGGISLVFLLVAVTPGEKKVRISENTSLEWDVWPQELRLAYRW